MRAPFRCIPVMGGGNPRPGRAWALGIVISVCASALTSPVMAGDWPSCDEDAGDCFSAHLTPGCECPECCNLICAIEPFCCEVQWDSSCVAFDATIPRWQIVGRAVSSCTFEALPKVLWREVDAELTTLVLAERRHPGAVAGATRSRVVPELTWWRDEGEGAVTLRLDEEPAPRGEREPEPVFTVVARECPGHG